MDIHTINELGDGVYFLLFVLQDLRSSNWSVIISAPHIQFQYAPGPIHAAQLGRIYACQPL
jgi:hypothetical protein